MTATDHTELPPEAAGLPPHASDILLDFIVAFLAPMFLAVSGGELHLARMTALETIGAYRARSNADLIAAAQVIAFGFAALGSLSLSLADTASASMALRLRGNANACNRSAEQNRRALNQSRTEAPAPQQPDVPPPDPAEEAALAAKVAKTRRRVAQAQAVLNAAAASSAPKASTPAPVTPAPTAPAPATPTVPKPAQRPTQQELTDQQRQAIWAAAMSDVAKEFTDSLPHLPPAERRAASFRAAVLNNCANQLISGEVPTTPLTALPPLPVPRKAP